ncbi:hypothetical protein OF83DRAFT_1085593 [Amylostereum chailletii]|nr:hypothetical protein OF83DRAFT_1085593 [Amylostereum chailletii]
MRLFIPSLLLVGLIRHAVSQDFSVPSSWRVEYIQLWLAIVSFYLTNDNAPSVPPLQKPTSSLDFVQRSALARGATNAITPLIDPSQGTIDDLVAVLALQDVYSGNGTNENFATNNLQLFQAAGHSNYYSDNQYWGLAAYYTYRAYKQDFLLQIATGVWDQASTYFVTEAQAENKTHPTRNVTIASQCNGTSTAGAVFWCEYGKADDAWQLPDTLNDTGTNGETVGLSAYLFETTRDSKYSNAAELTGEFIRNHMYNGTIVLDGINIASCVQGTGLSTYNTGYYVEALAVLANVTSNATWSGLLGDLVANSARFGAWTRSDGVITESGNDNAFLTSLKSTLIRGLHETWARGDRSSAMANYIQSFITVQFNALLDLATIAGSNNYTQSWVGPPLPELHSSGNVAALDVLNAMFDMATRPAAVATSSSAASSSTSTASNYSSKKSSSNTGAIVGGVVGGIVGAIVIAGIIIFLCIRRRRYPTALEVNPDAPDSPHTRQVFHVEPFLADSGTPPPTTTSWVNLKGRPAYTGQGISTPALSSVSPPTTESITGSSSVAYQPVPQDASLAELPALVRRLNGLLGQAASQDLRGDEPPPEYHSNVH